MNRVHAGCALVKAPSLSVVQIIEAFASTRLRKRSSLSRVARSARFLAVTSAITMPTPSDGSPVGAQGIEVDLIGANLISPRVAGRLDFGACRTTALQHPLEASLQLVTQLRDDVPNAHARHGAQGPLASSSRARG